MTKFSAPFLLALSAAAALSLQNASVFASPISNDGAGAGYRGPATVQTVPVAAVQTQVATPNIPLVGGLLNNIPLVGPLVTNLLGGVLGGGSGGGLLGGLLGGGGGGGGLLGGILKVDVGKTDDAN